MTHPERNKNTLVRAVRIGFVLAEFFVFHRLNRHRELAFGARIRGACERLGLVFIKVGQVLSTRYDLLPKEDCVELQKLLDEVPEIPYAEVERIFMEDFGRPPEELFDRFERRPLASASVSQVHTAFLRGNGEKVAVKVRRPGVGGHIRADMNILRQLVPVAKLLWPRTRRVDLKNILDQAEAWLWTETDFRQEADNMEKVEHYYDTEGRDIAGEYGHTVVWPLPRRQMCSGNVLTMDFLEGVLAKNFRAALGNPEYDVERSMVSFLRGVLRNWMSRDTFYFHGDPHPSNVMIMPGGRLGLLDMGLIGKFDREQVRKTQDLFLAIYVKDADRAMEILLDVCKVPRGTVVPGLRASAEDYIEKAHHSGLGFWFSAMVDVCVRHDLPLPYDLILFGRMQTILDGLFQTVLPHKTTMDILGEELARALKRRIASNIREVDFASLLYVVSEKLKQAPDAAARMVDRYFDEPLDLLRDVAIAMRGYGAPGHAPKREGV